MNHDELLKEMDVFLSRRGIRAAVIILSLADGQELRKFKGNRRRKEPQSQRKPLNRWGSSTAEPARIAAVSTTALKKTRHQKRKTLRRMSPHPMA